MPLVAYWLPTLPSSGEGGTTEPGSKGRDHSEVQYALGGTEEHAVAPSSSRIPVPKNSWMVSREPHVGGTVSFHPRSHHVERG